MCPLLTMGRSPRLRGCGRPQSDGAARIDNFRLLVRAYLDLIDSQASTDAEKDLALVLDELAFKTSRTDPSTCDVDPELEPVIESYEAVRKRVSVRFPDFGFYNLASDVDSKVGESDCMVGDAIDDITDIYQDLAKAEWNWQNSTEQEAIWALKFSFDTHWERHLRELQIYLLARRSG